MVIDKVKYRTRKLKTNRYGQNIIQAVGLQCTADNANQVTTNPIPELLYTSTDSCSLWSHSLSSGSISSKSIRNSDTAIERVRGTLQGSDRQMPKAQVMQGKNWSTEQNLLN